MMTRINAEHFAALPSLHDNVPSETIACKICSAPAVVFDVVDFNKCCDPRLYPFGLSHIPIIYHRCEACSFIFTTFCDSWTAEDLSQFIYNDEYVFVDPEYTGARATRTASHISQLLGGCERARVLDYGSGSGIFAEALKTHGFADTAGYDPFSEPKRPTGLFQVITCVEVVEHAVWPLMVFEDLLSLLAPDGAIIIGTGLQPANIGEIRCNWWYIAPRNGHVSIYAQETLTRIADKLGLILRIGSGFCAFSRPTVSSTIHTALDRIGPPLNGVNSLDGPTHDQPRRSADQDLMKIKHPPNHLAGVGGGVVDDFFEAGRPLFETFLQQGYISRDSAVLDVGCGVGRMAVHFATFLSPPGRYEGFDVEGERIAWCSANITPAYPHARFLHIPLYNSFYAPDAEHRAEDFSFPYEDRSFDFILLASVFTHLTPGAARNYMREIARVLKPTGCCFASFYLMNDDKRAGIAAQTAAFTFPYSDGGFYAQFEDNPDAVAAYEEGPLSKMLSEAGLRCREPIAYGVWHTHGIHGQDLLVLETAFNGVIRLGAPANDDPCWNGRETGASTAFRWTNSSEVRWPAQHFAAGRIQLRIPYLLEIVPGFAQSTRVFLGEHPLQTEVSDGCIVAAVTLTQAAAEIVRLVTPPLHVPREWGVPDRRTLGLAIPILSDAIDDDC